jgi:hypothetical protein
MGAYGEGGPGRPPFWRTLVGAVKGPDPGALKYTLTPVP